MQNPVVLDGAMRVAEAKRAVASDYLDPAPDLSLEWAVVRRKEGEGVRLLLFAYYELRARLDALDDEMAVWEGLQTQVLPSCDLERHQEEIDRLLAHEGVLLAGEQVLELIYTGGYEPAGVGAEPPEATPPEALPPEEEPGEMEPFEAYPGIAAPEQVQPGETFDVQVWLSREQVAGVQGPGEESTILVELPADQQQFELDVQLVARGFQALTPGWRQRLTVDRHKPDRHRLTFRLRAPSREQEGRRSVLQVHFSHRGVPCGFFWREIVVGTPAEPPVQPPEEPQAEVLQFTLSPAVWDLTVRISKADGDHGTGLFTWTFESPHELRLPAGLPECDLGARPEAFAKALIDLVPQVDGQDAVVGTLEGAAMEVADKMPSEFWELLDELEEKLPDREPSLLFLSEESHVPWELAWVENPRSATRPQFLGAQYPVARWILSSARSGPPNQPPKGRIVVSRLTVIAGDYASESGLRPLPEALAEAAKLKEHYGAVTCPASTDHLSEVFSEEHETQILHFACHGEADPASPQYSRILLQDGVPLSPLMVRSAKVGRHSPLVFLNACQVGTAGEMLGEYAGFAAAFLKSGCAGFVAPLWSVDDVVAREVAEYFYQAALKEGAAIPAVMRELRSRFWSRRGDSTPPAATYLAYVYYGHPDLRLIPASKGGGDPQP